MEEEVYWHTGMTWYDEKARKVSTAQPRVGQESAEHGSAGYRKAARRNADTEGGAERHLRRRRGAISYISVSGITGPQPVNKAAFRLATRSACFVLLSLL